MIYNKYKYAEYRKVVYYHLSEINKTSEGKKYRSLIIKNRLLK
jgi:hypothetical protein